MKLIQLEKYVGTPVDNPCITIQINPNNINYMYKVENAGKSMTCLVFVGDTKVVVPESMDKVKRILEEQKDE